MTEITVIHELEEHKILSLEEKTALYQVASKELNIPFDYFNEIIKLESLTISPKPDILVLLLRRIMQYNNVIPVVKSLPIIDRTVDEMRTTYGGRLMQKRLVNKPIHKPVIDTVKKEYVIPTSLTNYQKCLILQDVPAYLANNDPALLYNFAAGENMLLCGLIIEPHTPTAYYADSIFTMNQPGKIRSGNWTSRYLYNDVFLEYELRTSEKLADNLKKIGFTVKGKKCFYQFINEESTKHIANMLYDLLAYYREFYRGDYIFAYLHLNYESPSAVKKPSMLFKHINRLYDIYLEPEIVKLVDKDRFEYKNKTVMGYLTDLEPLVMGKFHYGFDSSIWMDIVGLKLVLFLEKAIIVSKTDGVQKKDYILYLDAVLQRINDVNLSRAQNQTRKDVIFRNIVQEMRLRWIYIQKFGYLKFLELFKPVYYGTVRSELPGTKGKLFEQIDKKEQDLVMLELRALENYLNAIDKNTAPWVKIVLDLRAANNPIDMKKHLDDLQQFLSNKAIKAAGEHDFIRSADGLPIVCPHVIDLVNMEIRGRSDEYIHEIIQKYATDTVLYQAYYCKICGEAITYNEDMQGIQLSEGGNIQVMHSLDEGLKTYIWKQVNQIVRNYLQFKDLFTNRYINQFISNVTGNLYDFVNIIDKSLRKSKTSTEFEIDAKLRLFTVIYVYALLIKVVQDNYQKITFKNIAKTYEKIKFDKLVNYCIDKIITTQNIIIAKLPDINEEFIRSALLKTHKNIEALLGKSELQPPPPLNILDTLVLDPIYHYLVNMTTISQCLRNAKTGNVKQYYEHSLSTQTLFGKKYNELAADKFIFEHAKIPKFPSEYTDALKKMSAKTLPADIYPGYMIDSFYKFMDYVAGQTYLEPVFITTISINQHNENIVTFNVQENPAFMALMKKYEYIKNIGTALVELQLFYRYLTFQQLPFMHDIKFTEQDFHLVKINQMKRRYGYDINTKSRFNTAKSKSSGSGKFHKHRFDIIAYVTHAKFKGYGVDKYDDKTVRVFSDFADIYTSHPEYYDLVPIDKICDVCYYGLSEIMAKNVDAGKILEAEQQLIGFYNYYENRCPLIFDIHDFSKTDKCKRCGITREIIINHDAAYYNKYIGKFKADIKAQEHVQNQELISASLVDADIIKKMSPPADEWLAKWKYSNLTSEFANKTYDAFEKGSQIKNNVNDVYKFKKAEYGNLILNLGLFEKYEFERILKGQDTPYKSLINVNAETRAIALTQINKLDIYIKELIFDYNTLINNKNIGNLPIEIKQIVEFMSAEELAGLQKLPDINVVMFKSSRLHYLELLQAVKQHFRENYVKVAEFVQEYLLNGLLNVVQEMNKIISKKISHEFLVYFMTKIITMEKITAKLKEAKAVVMEAGQKTNLADDPNMQDHFQSHMDDDLKKEKAPSFQNSDAEDPGIDAGAWNIQF